MDAEARYRALVARDRRFDGVFFTGVSTTGIYCRPICPARTPGRDRCAFFDTAAQAERAGFRACLRCRPELAPGHASVDARSRLTRAALARIEAGALNGGSVDALAAGLGVTARHLRRTLVGELGIGPLDYAATQRLALAKRLLHDTALPMTEIAFASGFSSVRRFNAAFVARFGRDPSTVRRAASPGGAARSGGGAARSGGDAARSGGGAARPEGGAAPRDGGAIVLRLDYRPPLDWASMITFLAARAIPGVEEVTAAGEYRRTVRLGEARGWLVARDVPERAFVAAELSASLAPVTMPLVAALRALFDLDARPHAIVERLRSDPFLGLRVERRPGLRVPGAFDALETAVRTVVGQQISVKGATKLAGSIARDRGSPIATPFPALDRLFPIAAALADAPLGGMPASRAATIRALARAPEIRRGDHPGDVEERLLAIPGVGPWTASYLSMRMLGWPDAFPSSDLGIAQALGLGGRRAIEARAEAWRPWRSYAAMHLWRGE